jgi:hypothetical protein
MSMMKNGLSRFACIALLISASAGSYAQALDGFVSPSFTYAMLLNTPSNAVTADTNPSATTDEKKSRMRFDLQFGRLQRNVEFDVGLGSGGGYSDVGAVLRIFNHFYFSEKSATGISLGLGGGARYSSVGIFAPVTSSADAQRTFYELTVSPFVRFIWDPMWGSFGLALETGIEAVPRRNFTDDLTPGSDSQARIRYYAGITLLISSRWLE